MRRLLLLPTVLAVLACREAPDNGTMSWAEVNDYAYQLQDVDLEELGESRFDLAIVDYSRDGDDETRYTTAEVAALKAGPGGSKLVLAYMSIGEAENYRWYWHEEWDADHDGEPDPGAPSWLGPANPEWPDNYPVHYWEQGWLDIILGNDGYLSRIITAGFDGVYLDIIDGYEYWGPGGESGLNRPTAEAEMVAFVQAIAAQAPDGFGIFPQNGEGLGAHADYLAAVTGIGREDVWYDDNEPQPAEDTSAACDGLDRFLDADKLVLVVDYVTRKELIDDFYARAEARGYVPYATVRDLDRLTTNPGHEPD
jgi:cysteinyl-tRNA synthetase